MSGLKNAWEIGMEKSDKMVPDLKDHKKLTKKQKEEIAEIRIDYKARIADKDVTFQHNLNKLADRIPPEELEAAGSELKMKFAEEKEQLEKEMESKVEAVRDKSA